MSSVFKAGNTAVITGGASGIGLALAKRCLSAGMKVLVADYNDEALSATPKEISTIKADVSSLNDWAKVKSKIETELGGKINLLALNAGRSVNSAGWGDITAFYQTLDTNLYGVINGIHTLLPTMQKTAGPDSQAAIVITGSKQGITNPPGNPAYNASKAAVKTLAEHLSWDLKGTSDISVHLLVPGWTFTGLTGNKAGSEGKKPEGAWWPEQVVEHLEKKMGEGKFYVLCPDDDVSEETDQKRMLWSVMDLVQGRPPLTRWRPEYTEEAKEWMETRAPEILK